MTSLIEEKQYPIFRLWEAPSFEPIVTWTILVDRRPGEYRNPMVRRVIGSKFTSLTFRDIFKAMREDMSGKDAQVDNCYLKPHRFEALKLFQPLPFQILSTDYVIGCDGTIFGMQNCVGQPDFMLEWWEDGPAGWREVIDWATQTRTFLSYLIDRPDVDFKDVNQRYPPDHKIWTRLDK